MGGAARGVGARPPSQEAYYVALAGVVALLALLICYFVYFCVKRVKELLEADPAWVTPTPARPPPAYPVQPVVRDGASAMAKLCKQIPPPRGGTVHPARSPAAAPAHGTPITPPAPTGPPSPIIPVTPAPAAVTAPKIPAPAAVAAVTRIEITPAS